MAAPVPQSQPYPEIPDKLYFRIGEVSQLAGVKPYVLRYWETEFAGIGPKKSGSNHRLYRRKDVELILDIKHLLYEKRYTIEGARKLLMGEGRAATRARSEAKAESLAEARAENRALAKPVQAANSVVAPVAMAVGGSGASGANSGSSVSGASSPVAATLVSGISSGLASGLAGTVIAANGVSSAPTAVAAASSAPVQASSVGELGVSQPNATKGSRALASAKAVTRDPDLVGSIRKELLSLLHLLAD